MGLFVPFLLVQALLISLFSPHSAIHRRPIHPHKPLKPSNDSLFETKYVTQNLDHFDYTPDSYKTFQQRYLINSKDWDGAKKKGPIFVFIGGQGDIRFEAINSGFMFVISKYLKSLLVFVEHRYYGESIPFGSRKVAFKNSTTLGYLNTGQALADVATLVVDLEKNLSATESPVVVFGGGYGGILAAWFRLKYPHIAHGALASSASILSFEDLSSPYGFSDIITKNIKEESENCYNVVKNSWDELKKIISNKGGISKLTKTFKLCKPLPPTKLFQNRLLGLVEFTFIYASVSNYPTESNVHIPLPAYPLKKICEAIDNPKTGHDTALKLYGAVNVYLNYTKEATCFNLSYSDSGKHNYFNGWEWQSCTELIERRIQNNEESIFPTTYKNQHSDLDRRCDIWNITARPHWITTEFGGHNIKRVLKRFGSNIIFFNGLKDPFSAGGVLESISKSIVAINAAEGAHSVDLLLSGDNDPDWLGSVREKEVKIIQKWLEEYNEDDNEV